MERQTITVQVWAQQGHRWRTGQHILRFLKAKGLDKTPEGVSNPLSISGLVRTEQGPRCVCCSGHPALRGKLEPELTFPASKCQCSVHNMDPNILSSEAPEAPIVRGWL